MRMNNLFLSMLLMLIALMGSQKGFAANYECQINPNTPMTSGNPQDFNLSNFSYEPSRGNWVATSPGAVSGQDYYKCDDVIPGKLIRPEEVRSISAHLAPGGSIDTSKSQHDWGFAGKRFVRLKNTGSKFLDDYAWIQTSFDAVNSVTIGTEDLWYGTKDLRLSGTSNTKPGLDLRMNEIYVLLTAEPTESYIATLNLMNPKLDIELTNGDTITSALPTNRSNITLIISPNNAKTCEVSPTTVNLPPITIREMQDNPEPGKTSFDITAVCPISSSQRVLKFKVLDNFATAGSQTNDYFSDYNFGRPEQTNVSFKIFHRNSGVYLKPNHGSPYEFGTLMPGQVTKTNPFYVWYSPYPGSTPKPGPVLGSASILVYYD